MGKAVLLSIKPKWCEKILNGEKKIEIRKTKPNLEPPFKCYIYQTKIHLPARIAFGRIAADPCGVVAEFVCDKIIDVDCDSVAPFDYDTKEYIPECCMLWEDLMVYNGMTRSFGWHISDLKVYDEPKPLSEFHKPCSPACNFSNECGGTDTKECMFGIERVPQSWYYVEELK